jgi:hypothetical protein
MSAEHVLSALKDIEFEHLVPELEASLANYRQVMKDKKSRKSNSKATEEEEIDTEDVEMIEDE